MVRETIAQADQGAFISEEAMSAWFMSLGTDNELAEPEPDFFSNARLMKIIFLAAAHRDLIWFKRYYMEVFRRVEKRPNVSI